MIKLYFSTHTHKGENKVSVWPALYLFSELFIYHVPPPGNHWWKARYSGNWIFCGGCAWGEHQGRDLLLRWSFDQVQSQITCWCLRRACRAGLHWTNRSDVRVADKKWLRTWLPWMKLWGLSYLGGFGDGLANSNGACFNCYRVAELFIWFALWVIFVIYAGFSL